ncbi:MAG: hypothetical protein HYY52_00965 [Candidatus Melainabacteria bacterium]|nr:hypothetical protein [Candidatus Melainabacteria bacterium]
MTIVKYEITKKLLEERKDCTHYDEKYFDIPIKKKNYPSCYNYNLLIMLAKKLIKQDSYYKVYQS